MRRHVATPEKRRTAMRHIDYHIDYDINLAYTTCDLA
jgi:hypothetical protein